MAGSRRALWGAGVLLAGSALTLSLGIRPSGAQIATRPPAPLSRLSPVALKAEPASIQLIGPRAQARVLVTAIAADGSPLDVTDKVKPAAINPALIRIENNGTLRPLRDGATLLRFTYAGHTVTARVTVKGATRPAPISFTNEILPLLTRIGCNQGACHGAQAGKAGFHLSLAGFDPDLDYQNIVKQAKGRRVSLADPTHSLLLLKPTMTVPHGGGRRLEPGSPDYALLVRWLQDGAPGPNAADPTVANIAVFPSERILHQGGSPQRLVVRATYSDGTTRDVTAHARIDSLNDAIAACTPEGIVTPVGQGQTAIRVRYGGQATISTVIVPFTRRAAATKFASHKSPIANPVVASLTRSVAAPPIQNPKSKTQNPADSSAQVDALVAQKQRQLGLAPSPVCHDRTFARRVFLDLIGTAPTPQELAGFLADKRPDKRARLVDSLLARPEYADYWALKWGDLLRSNRTSLGPKGMWSFTNWIHSQFQQNRPLDQFTRDLILAQGSTFTNGPSNYYRVASDPQSLAETTSQVFLGVRMQCAKCHNHPFEKWTQKDYYQFAAFFARVGLKSSDEFGIFGNEQVVRINDDGEVNHPKTGAVMYPTPLGVKLAALPNGKMPDPDANGDRRRALADWLVGKQNRLFARNIANRYWGYLLGKGIVNPIDDQRVTNPPTNAALLDRLADEFVQHGYDVKHLLRVICLSRTYQRSSQATPENMNDDLFFTHYLPKRLPAETLLDAIDSACGTREKYPELPKGTRAIQLPDPAIGSDFLDVFGRPQRLIACECERVAEPNLSQTLTLMNGEMVNRKVSEDDGRIAQLLKANRSDSAILNELYLVTLGRPPSWRERSTLLGVLAFSADRKPVFEDVLLTLLNSKEFLFNH